MKQNSCKRFVSGSVLALALIAPSSNAAETAGHTLYSYETDAQLKLWSVQDGTARISPKFASVGKNSLVIETAEWKHGMNEWPVWQVVPEVKDWSAYDRVVLDVVNPTPFAELLRFKVADGGYFKLGSAEWPAASFTIQPRSHMRIVLPFTKWFASNFDTKDIRQVLFYTARAPHDYTLHIDNFTLLTPGQEPAPLSSGFRREIRDLRLEQWSLPQANEALDGIKRGIDAGAAKGNTPAEVTAWANSSYNSLRSALTTTSQQAKSDQLSTEEIAKIGDEADAIAKRGRRLASLVQLRQKSAAVFKKAPYAVGWANAMEKVLPKDMPIPTDVAASKAVDVARNESESLQLVVVPFGQSLKNCRIQFGKFSGPGGASLPAQSLDARVVGFVQTRQPAYEVDYVGWWPDPLLDFMKSVDIEPEIAQTFWVRVKAPKTQRAGTYNGEILILADGRPATTLKLTVKVRDFEMPDRSPMLLSNQISGAEFFNKYSNEDWSTLKYKVTDFLSDYYIDYDNMYRHGPPDFDLLKRLRDKGRLSAFCLSTLSHTSFPANMSEEAYQKAFATLVSEIEAGYQIAKKEELLKYAYLYGMDEIPVPHYPILKRLATDIKAKYPDLPILTTAMDFSYGERSGATDVDGWVPIIHEYDLERADKLRAKGKKVWWYTCQSPSHPYPNIFTEYPSIDIRLLMGFMAAKMRPDGFLYYCLFRDQGPPRKAITSGPFTEWDPCAFIEPFNGEGYLAYPGSDGRAPMASIRLENFRDGLEDYAYHKILKATVQKVRAGKPTKAQQAWLLKADKQLAVPDSLVKNAANFSKEPGAVYAYRRQTADLIEQAGTKPGVPVWPTL